MYPNLNAELARLGWSRRDLSEKTGIRYQTLIEKLNGNSPITFEEVLKIKKAMGLELSAEYIFFS